jgi:hypothetical protein
VLFRLDKKIIGVIDEVVTTANVPGSPKGFVFVDRKVYMTEPNDFIDLSSDVCQNRFSQKNIGGEDDRKIYRSLALLLNG